MSRLRRVFGAIRDRYAFVDPRTAGLFRLVLGLLLVLDLIRHASYYDTYYTITGVFPSDKHLWQPTSGHLFSLFHAFSTRGEVLVMFGLGLFAHLGLLLGYRSRLFAFLSFLFVTSRDSRIPLIENGGYVVVNLLCLYASLLPIGQRFSVDAWLRSWRARRERSVEELSDREPIRAPTARVRTLVGLLVVFNVAFIYFFNVVNKTGHIWRAGDTVHYVLHIDRMVTGVAVLAREILPEPLMKAADFGTLSLEAFLFVAILWPSARYYTRALAVVGMISLHATFGVMMRLGPFSWFMCAWSLLLLLPVHWDELGARHRGEPVRLRLQEGSPLALVIGRVLARLDVLGKITFEPGARAGTLVELAEGEAGELGLRVARALPLGRALAPLVRAPLALLRRNPARIERFFGLDHTPLGAPPSAPLRARLRRALSYAREGLVAYLFVCFVMQMWLENKVIPKQVPPELKPGQVLRPDEQRALALVKRLLGDRVITLKPDSPKFLQMTITYPRLFQGWGMFAPNPIQDDGVLAIDARTVTGLRIDPLRNAPPDLDLTDSRGEGLGQIPQDYGNRIRLDRNQFYRDGLAEWLRNRHLRTGNPEDEIVSFDVYWVRDKCPKPGFDEPTHGEAVPILVWRKPGFVYPNGERLPRPPALRSAEKWDDKK